MASLLQNPDRIFIKMFYDNRRRCISSMSTYDKTKLRTICFRSGMFGKDAISFRYHRTCVAGVIYQQLKYRQNCEDLLLVTVDEIRPSKVASHIYFSFVFDILAKKLTLLMLLICSTLYSFPRDRE
ncbi:hypothetical protein J3Q64DRAFT_1695120 [Phycomyces blakesleeanus]|uniref:Uncharacterized protein n=2 Tax=Phycomyces blakesleeanus TaxID=4837 RepID=A0A167K0A1_PHYB8|nr:hypothetical protein PHYBLDRAFT_174717 [Phycomyces blakesleeanus NRRL 1555(-)]OAD67010.1 hypothetical protein PHYBLDRAFT_174717 [Phycomyces blakesleeanus NRRL 1555(-)]|eukprot:XP_018285050.1 hypothetical protein PHYBLDRAFT_174717 [Phycomyces blakesleeanus NRRL 1555(-)]